MVDDVKRKIASLKRVMVYKGYLVGYTPKHDIFRQLPLEPLREYARAGVQIGKPGSKISAAFQPMEVSKSPPTNLTDTHELLVHSEEIPLLEAYGAIKK